ncbi:hypothetical protein GCM10010524_06580 [Streptomyces mexicanus]
MASGGPGAIGSASPNSSGPAAVTRWSNPAPFSHGTVPPRTGAVPAHRGRTRAVFRRRPQTGCRHRDARHPSGRMPRLLPHHCVCLRHRACIGPPDIATLVDLTRRPRGSAGASPPTTRAARRPCPRPQAQATPGDRAGGTHLEIIRPGRNRLGAPAQAG